MIVARPRYLPPKIDPYVVRERRRVVQNVRVPIEQSIYEPIIQPVIHQEIPEIETEVVRRFQPVIRQQIIPQYRTELREGRPAPARRLPAVVHDERLAPTIQRVAARQGYGYPHHGGYPGRMGSGGGSPVPNAPRGSRGRRRGTLRKRKRTEKAKVESEMTPNPNKLANSPRVLTLGSIGHRRNTQPIC